MARKATDSNDLTKFKLKDIVYRVENADSGDFIHHDKEKCTGCGQCVMVCAAGLWSVPRKGNKARLSPKYREHCLECAACYAMCDADAIDFRYPNGGAGIIIKHG